MMNFVGRRVRRVPDDITTRCMLISATGPILLGNVEASEASDRSWKELPRHREEAQVELDVDRAFVYYPYCQYMHDPVMPMEP